MAPSKRAGDASSSEISLKALVFADFSFAAAPKFDILNSVHNVPLLTWQLAVLARYGVQEAIVLSREPIDIPYTDPLDRMKVTPLCSRAWACEGDALREVEIRSDLRPQDDFVVVRSGAIFNLNVMQLLLEHKARRAKDRNWLLTSVFSHGNGGNVVMSTDSEGMILKYDEGNGVPGGINISITNDDSIDIYTNVLDVGVDICAPEFLLEFKECFDYNRVRDLTIEKLDSGDAETMGNRMYARFVSTKDCEYAARIVTLKQLFQVTNDVRRGYMMPVELEKDHNVASKNVLGEGVTLGKNCTVRNSIIGSGSKIGDGVHIDSCIVAENCTLENNARGAKGCVLDAGVVIGEGFQGMKENVLITRRRDEDFFETEQDDDDDDDETDEKAAKFNGTTWDADDVGTGGIGRVVSAAVAARIDPYFVGDTIGADTSDSDSDEDTDGEQNAEEDATNGAPGRAGVQEEFRRELYELIEKGRLEAVELDNTLLEANSLRMVYDVTFAEMLAGTVIAIARNAMAEVSDNDSDAVFAAYTRMFEKYSGLTAKYVVQQDGTLVVENIARNFENEGMHFSRLLMVLYEGDVVEEDAILAWAEKQLPPVDNQHMKGLINWLQADDDSDEE